MDTLDFSLITPEATFFSGPAHLVEAPGTLGDFGVLPGHMGFISTLRPGIVAVHDEKNAVTRIFVASGIAQVDNTSCTILAERVIDLTKLTRADAEAQLAAAKLAVDNAYDEPAETDAQRDLQLAEAIVAALTAHHS